MIFNASFKFSYLDFGVGKDSTISLQNSNQGKRYSDGLVLLE